MTESGWSCALLRKADARQRQIQHGTEALLRWPENPDATMAARRVGSDVREIQVQCNQYAIFGAARSQQCGLRNPGKPFGQRSLNVVARSRKAGLTLRGRFSSSLNRRGMRLCYAGTGTILSRAKSVA